MLEKRHLCLLRARSAAAVCTSRVWNLSFGGLLAPGALEVGVAYSPCPVERICEFWSGRRRLCCDAQRLWCCQRGLTRRTAARHTQHNTQKNTKTHTNTTYTTHNAPASRQSRDDNTLFFGPWRKQWILIGWRRFFYCHV